MKRNVKVYWLAFCFLALKRLINRYPESTLPEILLENEFFITALIPLYGLFAILFCMYATFNIFEDRGVGSLLATINAMVSPFFWALIMIPQMIYILCFREDMTSGKTERQTVIKTVNKERNETDGSVEPPIR